MKGVEYYLSLNYRKSVYQDDDGDYIVEVDELPGCVADGRTPDEAFENLRHAMKSWLESRIAGGLEVPEPKGKQEYSGRMLLRMPKYLHHKLADQARFEGVSQNKYIVSLLAEGSGQLRGTATNVRAGKRTTISQ